MVEDAGIDIRHGFAQKILGDLTVQLLVTCGVVAVFLVTACPKDGESTGIGCTVQLNLDLHLNAALGVWVASIIMYYNKVDTSKNYWLLAVFTPCYGYVLAVLCVYEYSKSSVIFAIPIAVTFAFAFLLVLFACQTKRDFLGKGPFVYVGFWWTAIMSVVFFMWAGNTTMFSTID